MTDTIMNNQKKKIDVVVKYFYPVAAGIETNILETYSVLIKEGWDVMIHTSNVDYTTGKILLKEETIRGLRVVRYPLLRFHLLPAVNWGDTDLVCLHNFNALPHFFILVYSLLLKILGKKKFALVITPHGGFNPEWTIFSKPVAFLKMLYHYTVGIFLINTAGDIVRAVSEWEKNEIIGKGIHQNKVVGIANGIENEAYLDVSTKASMIVKTRVKKLGRYIIQIGRIYPIKNYETVIYALPFIDKKVKFVIVGPVADKKYRDYLKSLAKELGVDKRVVFYGVVRGVDKYYFIKHAETMVHMAIWESFCNVVNEGLSQGLIPIVADNTALPYLIKDGLNGYCVETKNYKVLAEKINFVLKNKNTREFKQISERNIKIGLEESWNNVAARMNDLYTELYLKKQSYIKFLHLLNQSN